MSERPIPTRHVLRVSTNLYVLQVFQRQTRKTSAEIKNRQRPGLIAGRGGLLLTNRFQMAVRKPHPLASTLTLSSTLTPAAPPMHPNPPICRTACPSPAPITACPSSAPYPLAAPPVRHPLPIPCHAACPSSAPYPLPRRLSVFFLPAKGFSPLRMTMRTGIPCNPKSMRSPVTR